MAGVAGPIPATPTIVIDLIQDLRHLAISLLIP